MAEGTSYLPTIILSTLLVVWVFSAQKDESVVKNVFGKALVWVDSIIFMIISKDSKGIGPKYNPDPDAIKSLVNDKDSKRIIFIRHGESDCKGFNIGLLGRLAKALWEETWLTFGAGSVFLDSPLNTDGIEQAIELRKEIFNSEIDRDAATKDIFELLRGEKESENASSVICSSSLRRALATTTLGLWPRLDRSGEKIYILSSLQETSRNVDTRALSSANEIPDLPNNRLEPHCKSSNTGTFDPDSVFDTSGNFGNKSLSFYGILRLKAFNDWVFGRKETTIIAGGHSLWFKNYFQTYLPHKLDHDAKAKKMVNSGVVSFILQRAMASNGKPLYRIDPDSIVVVHGGFETPKLKVK